MRCARNLERTRARNECLVLERILHRTKAVTKGVLRLLDRMWVWPLDEKRYAFGILDILDERVLLLAESVLVHETCPAENVRGEIVDGVLGNAAANELQPT